MRVYNFFFDIFLRSGDIHDETPKLSEITPNFEFCQILGGAVPTKVVPKLSCLPRGTSRGKGSCVYCP